MSQFSTRAAGSLTSAVAAAAVNVQDYESADFWVTGTFAGTIQVQESVDGTNYVNVGSALTAPGRIDLTDTAKFARMNCTAYTSGTIVGTIAGRDADKKG